MFRTIVVGTDGSRTADRAMRKATDLARLCSARLHVVTAYRLQADMTVIGPMGIALGADRSRDPARKADEATFERNGPRQTRPAGTEYAPKKPVKRAAAGPCQYKPVMSDADMQACRRK